MEGKLLAPKELRLLTVVLVGNTNIEVIGRIGGEI
jgi:hypothetical protein